MIRNIFNIFIYFIKLPFNLLYKKKEAPLPTVTQVRNNNKSTAIILIHGFTGNAEDTWSIIIKHLKGSNELQEWDIYSVNYSTRLTPDLAGIWSADAPISTLARLFSTVLEVPPIKGYKCLAILAHSMGGLIVQRALLNDVFTDRVSHVALFGTPSLGLKKVGITRFFKRQLRDMKFKSPFITTLREEWNSRYKDASSFKFIAVHGEIDEFVSSTSSIEPFSTNVQRVIPGHHLSQIKPDSADSVCIQLIIDFITEGAASTGPINNALIAVERNQFYKAIRLFESHANELDTEGLVQYALALEGVGRRADALAILSARQNNSGTDALGTLAGRFKRRWKLEHREEDGHHALSLYQDAYQRANAAQDHPQSYYLLVNVLYMKVAFEKRLDEAQSLAIETLMHCEKSPLNAWNLATQGEANLVLGRVDEALEKYQAAAHSKPTPSPRELQSMFDQATQVAALVGAIDFDSRMIRIFSEFPGVVTE